MTTLRFDGTDDWISGSGHGALTGALTYAALFKRAAATQNSLLMARTSAAATSSALYVDSANDPTWFNATVGVARSYTAAVITTDWWLIVVTRAAATSTPRFHIKNITLGTAWAHSDLLSETGNPPSALGGEMRVGRGSTTGYLNADLALIAWWDGTALNDAQAESLATNLRTSDWGALNPSSLTELTSLTPTDLKGLETWTRNGPTLAGADPPGWTFNGLGVSAPTNTVAPAVTGTAVNGQTLTCTTGTWTGSPTGYTYQWKRNGTAISGATSSTYTLVSADRSTSVKCTVTATNAGGSTAIDSNTVNVSVLDALPDVGDVLIRSSTGWITLN